MTKVGKNGKKKNLHKSVLLTNSETFKGLEVLRVKSCIMVTFRDMFISNKIEARLFSVQTVH